MSNVTKSIDKAINKCILKSKDSPVINKKDYNRIINELKNTESKLKAFIEQNNIPNGIVTNCHEDLLRLINKLYLYK